MFHWFLRCPWGTYVILKGFPEVLEVVWKVLEGVPGSAAPEKWKGVWQTSDQLSQTSLLLYMLADLSDLWPQWPHSQLPLWLVSFQGVWVTWSSETLSVYFWSQISLQSAVDGSSEDHESTESKRWWEISSLHKHSDWRFYSEGSFIQNHIEDQSRKLKHQKTWMKFCRAATDWRTATTSVLTSSQKERLQRKFLFFCRVWFESFRVCRKKFKHTYKHDKWKRDTKYFQRSWKKFQGSLESSQESLKSFQGSPRVPNVLENVSEFLEEVSWSLSNFQGSLKRFKSP